MCGVEGAGKKTFCSLFAPERKISVKKVSLKKKITKCLIIILFDGIRQQNIAEEKILDGVQDFMKTSPVGVEFEIWGVLTKVDAFYNKRKDPDEIKRNCSSYMELLLKRNIKPTLFIPLAQMAYYNLKYISENNNSNCEEECLDLRLMLGRLGIRFANDNDFIKLKEYVKLHERLLMNLIGVGIISRHLLAWTEGEVVLS